MAAIVGKKLGMTRVFLEDGSAVPVTVIEAAPNKVTAIRKADRDGYDAVQLAALPMDTERMTKAEAGHLKKAGASEVEEKARDAREGIPVTRAKLSASLRESEKRPTGARWKYNPLVIPDIDPGSRFFFYRRIKAAGPRIEVRGDGVG